MVGEEFPPAETTRLVAEKMKGLTGHSPQAGALRIVDAQGTGTGWPIRVRGTVESDQWQSARTWETEFVPEDTLAGESAEGNASALADCFLILVIEDLAVGPVPGIQEILQS
ncbi:hypothetical protein [Streptomyces sp. NPDC088910]|uniref:hypothetical protein n=1 Tax=Streptomyces sp. NPDC088910 TaxID=3365911 RepID=UPI003821B183